MELGNLILNVVDFDTLKPIQDAKIDIYEDINSKPLYSAKTNSIGQTEMIPLNAPNIDYSEKPSENFAYSKYTIRLRAETYREVLVQNSQIFPKTNSIQPILLNKLSQPTSSFAPIETEQVINVKNNTLSGGFPRKIPEAEEKVEPPPTGLVVLDQPVIPQYIIVHDGVPDDPSAPNYYERFRDYIKNVASSEIYPTWPETTIRANILCILSFTLNRVFTEWYRGKGKNFTITSSTAYDHAYSRGRNIYENISRIVDEIFTDFVKRPGKRQPLLTQYCDGKDVSCPGWLTQWGSKYLGDKGVPPFDILASFYGYNLSLDSAKKVLGVPASYPGYNLSVGSTGTPVRTIQRQLNGISDNYPLIPKVKVDGVYGKTTADSVKIFQQIFFLPQTGVVDYSTWYKISDTYVAVTKLAELT